MLQIEIHAPDGTKSLLQVADDSVIGKGAQSEVRLDSWRVGKEHARVFKTPSGIHLEDMGAFSGVQVNSRRIDGQYGPLRSTDVIEIGPYRLKVAALGVEGGLVQAAHPRSRSDSAPHRNEQATEELRASRMAAEAAQQAVLRARDVESAGATPHAGTPRFELTVAPDPGHKQREFEWRKKIHTKLLETMDLRRHDVSAMSDQKLREDTWARANESC